MAEVGLQWIRYRNNSHWDGLKIIRDSEIEKKISVDEFIALLGWWFMLFILKGNIYHGDIEYGGSTNVIDITFILKKQFKQSCTSCCIMVRSL